MHLCISVMAFSLWSHGLPRSMSPWESASWGKATTSWTSKTHIYGAPIFLPSHSSRGSTYLSVPLFDEDPSNNGNERYREYLSPSIFRMVETLALHVLQGWMWRKREGRIENREVSGNESERKNALFLSYGPL